MKPVKRMLDDSSSKKPEINGIVLVGGQLVSQRFNSS